MLGHLAAVLLFSVLIPTAAPIGEQARALEGAESAPSDGPVELAALPDGHLSLSILYAGNPGSEREKDYVNFLRASFERVTTTDYRTFEERQAAGHDVVIFDWTSVFPRDRDGKIEQPLKRLNRPKAPVMSENYSRPTILIGASGQEVIRPFRWKIDNLCHCLGDSGSLPGTTSSGRRSRST